MGLAEKFLELSSKTLERLDNKSVVLMPDFFIDTIISLPTGDKCLDSIRSKFLSGGGSIRNISQFELKGGNAVNMACALGRLNIHTTLATLADDFSKILLEQTFAKMKCVETSIGKGIPGRTTSLEFTENGNRSNVMLSDIGDFERFESSKLDQLVWRRIDNASFVVITNWATNLSGNELVETVFSRSKPHAKTFIDPADIGGREKEFAKFLKDKINLDLIDVVSMNNNEASLLARSLNKEPLAIDYSLEEIEHLASILSDNLSIRIDLHTPKGVASALGKESTSLASFNVDQKIATGAGDIWDSGNIAGYMLDFTDEQRLGFANACAALYISKDNYEPPTRQDVMHFLKSK